MDEAEARARARAEPRELATKTIDILKFQLARSFATKGWARAGGRSVTYKKLCNAHEIDFVASNQVNLKQLHWEFVLFFTLAVQGREGLSLDGVVADLEALKEENKKLGDKDKLTRLTGLVTEAAQEYAQDAGNAAAAPAPAPAPALAPAEALTSAPAPGPAQIPAPELFLAPVPGLAPALAKAPAAPGDQRWYSVSEEARQQGARLLAEAAVIAGFSPGQEWSGIPLPDPRARDEEVCSEAYDVIAQLGVLRCF